jgi:hypothetical protein
MVGALLHLDAGRRGASAKFLAPATEIVRAPFDFGEPDIETKLACVEELKAKAPYR